MVYGPQVQPFNYSALMTADDVQVELAKVVEDLAVWLGVVETGLNGVLDAVGQQGKDGLGFAGEAEEGDVDDSYDFDALDQDHVDTGVPAR